MTSQQLSKETSPGSGFEAVIGLEVHAQLLTRSKMFSECPNRFGSEPNSLIGPVCSGQPGSLPIINQAAIELGVRAAIALNCTIHEESIFARKHYFYPDLPKGYQISQFERPYSTDGKIEVPLRDGREKSIRIHRIHFEEDAGKSTHTARGTLVNLNRAGVPLIEIVTEPDMCDAHEAGQYLRTLHSILRYAGICDGNMEEGNFRCDANISVRPLGEPKLGTKVELKNINSFRYVEKAIEYEIERQVDAVKAGEKIVQETRLWNPDKGITSVMREKEQAHDYRYFPEPDLPPLVITKEFQQKVRSELPELPAAKKQRFVQAFALSEYDAGVLTSSHELADFFEAVVKVTDNAKASANWVMNELLGRLNAAGREISDSPVSAEHLAGLIRSVDEGQISGKIAKSVFDEMFETSKAPDVIIKDKGLVQISDTKQLESIVAKIIESNPKEAEAYRGGKKKLLGFFVGQAMKETKGQANPKLLNEVVQKVLGKS